MIGWYNKWNIEVFSCGKKILDGNLPQGENEELRIPISDC